MSGTVVFYCFYSSNCASMSFWKSVWNWVSSTNFICSFACSSLYCCFKRFRDFSCLDLIWLEARLDFGRSEGVDYSWESVPLWVAGDDCEPGSNLSVSFFKSGKTCAVLPLSAANLSRMWCLPGMPGRLELRRIAVCQRP